MPSRRASYTSLAKPRVRVKTEPTQRIALGADERQRLYRTQQWLRLRRAQLQAHPLVRRVRA
jgi:hypothetical protein